MALYPKAIKRLIPPSATDPRITPKTAVLHVDAGNATTLYGWFSDVAANGVESHFHIRRDGVVEQYRDTAYQADAQVGGAKEAVSIETQGFGSGSWTPEQVAAIKDLLLWLHATHAIPLRPPANPYDAGVGYHSMWSSSREGTWARDGRTCPGTDRIKQYNTVIVPWMRNATTTTPTPPQEDDMPTPAELWRWDGIPSPDKEASNPTWQADSYLRETYRLLRSTRNEVAALTTAVKVLAESQGVDSDAVVERVGQEVRARLAQITVTDNGGQP